MSTTRVRQHINTARERVYRLLVDADAVAAWLVPDGMTSHVHAFEPRPGGEIRISLTYEAPDPVGKTTAHTDTFHGRFVEVVPDERVAFTAEFETDNPAIQGEMKMTFALADATGGTDVELLHEGLPDGVSAEANEAGTRMSLQKLARLAEAT